MTYTKAAYLEELSEGIAKGIYTWALYEKAKATRTQYGKGYRRNHWCDGCGCHTRWEQTYKERWQTDGRNSDEVDDLSWDDPCFDSLTVWVCSNCGREEIKK